jgi:hypothetical protein
MRSACCRPFVVRSHGPGLKTMSQVATTSRRNPHFPRLPAKPAHGFGSVAASTCRNISHSYDSAGWAPSLSVPSPSAFSLELGNHPLSRVGGSRVSRGEASCCLAHIRGKPPCTLARSREQGSPETTLDAYLEDTAGRIGECRRQGVDERNERCRIPSTTWRTT